jgi:hypothetical protein
MGGFMQNEKMREEFEAWVKRGWPAQSLSQFNDGEYQGFTVQHCWDAWKASRESLVIELPPVREEPDTDGDGISEGKTAAWNIWVGDKLAKAECREAIEAAGLKVKP